MQSEFHPSAADRVSRSPHRWIARALPPGGSHSTRVSLQPHARFAPSLLRNITSHGRREVCPRAGTTASGVGSHGGHGARGQSLPSLRLSLLFLPAPLCSLTRPAPFLALPWPLQRLPQARDGPHATPPSRKLHHTYCAGAEYRATRASKSEEHCLVRRRAVVLAEHTRLRREGQKPVETIHELHLYKHGRHWPADTC